MKQIELNLMSLEQLEDEREMLMMDLQYRPGSDKRWDRMTALTKRIKELENG